MSLGEARWEKLDGRSYKTAGQARETEIWIRGKSNTHTSSSSKIWLKWMALVAENHD